LFEKRRKKEIILMSTNDQSRSMRLEITSSRIEKNQGEKNARERK
jgi:hypothetical protein